MSDEDVLTRTLLTLADTLVDDFDVVDLLTLLVDRSVQILGVDAAGLMLVSPDGDLRLAASSSEVMRVVELFELQAHEGPCLDCFHSGEPILDEDLTVVDGRWPAFAPIAHAAGFQTAHAIPLRLRGRVLGALNLFDTGAGLLSEPDVRAGRALADMATISILQHRAAREAQLVNEQLERALTSRVLIEQAKGVLAERANIDMGQAFTWLRMHARNHNLRLVEVAEAVIAGTLTGETLDRADDA